MKLPQSQRFRPRISLTPLIDVVFLLLVFFMLASTFLKFNYLPLTAGGEGAGAPSLSETVIVRVRQAGCARCQRRAGFGRRAVGPSRCLG